jgi:RNA polymerase sigma-70 factor (ECF subfamily)
MRRSGVDLVRDPDADLVAACRNPLEDGFESAFETLFLRYRDRAYSIAYRVTGSAVDAMDAVQESFGVVFRKLSGFRADSLFSTWLFRIVVNCSIDQRRREVARGMITGERAELAMGEAVAEGAGPDAAAATTEVGSDVQHAMGKLSPKLRAVLALRYLEAMSYDELSKTLEVSLGTVKSRLARAHLALERVIREQFPQLDLGGLPRFDGKGVAG